MPRLDPRFILRPDRPSASIYADSVKRPVLRCVMQLPRDADRVMQRLRRERMRSRVTLTSFIPLGHRGNPTNFKFLCMYKSMFFRGIQEKKSLAHFILVILIDKRIGIAFGWSCISKFLFIGIIFHHSREHYAHIGTPEHSCIKPVIRFLTDENTYNVM